MGKLKQSWVKSLSRGNKSPEYTFDDRHPLTTTKDITVLVKGDKQLKFYRSSEKMRRVYLVSVEHKPTKTVYTSHPLERLVDAKSVAEQYFSRLKESVENG